MFCTAGPQLHCPVTGCSWSASTLLIPLHFILNCISPIVSTVFLRHCQLYFIDPLNCSGRQLGGQPRRGSQAPICLSCAPNWQAELPARSLLRGETWIKICAPSLFQQPINMLLLEKVIFVAKVEIERKYILELFPCPSYHPRHPVGLSRRLKRALANVPIISVCAPPIVVVFAICTTVQPVYMHHQ